MKIMGGSQQLKYRPRKFIDLLFLLFTERKRVTAFVLPFLVLLAIFRTFLFLMIPFSVPCLACGQAPNCHPYLSFEPSATESPFPSFGLQPAEEFILIEDLLHRMLSYR